MTDPPAFAVAIPAHDEARTIGRALDAVFVAAAGTRPVVVVVAADACRDRTAAAVRARARHAPANVSVDVVEVQLRSAGAARHVAAGAAVRRLPPSVTTGAGCWLATTDADSTVPVDWLDGLRTWARRGADAVAGLVRVDARARLV